MFRYNSLSIPVSKDWVVQLLEEYQVFLEKYHVDQKTVYHHMKWATDTFVAMESFRPHELTYEWLASRTGMKAAKKSLQGFLLEKKIIKTPDPAFEAKKTCNRLIQKCPERFRKCILWYSEEKLRLHQRQVENNVSAPINVRTIVGDVMSLVKMVLYLKEHCPSIGAWNDVTDSMTNTFLLSLSLRSRECVRKDLYQFYKFALRKKFIFAIPMVDYKARDLPRATTTLTIEQQSELFSKVKETGLQLPYAAILTILSAYHAVSSSNIRKIRFTDVDLAKQRVHMMDIPDLFLTEQETVIMRKYLEMRKNFHLAETRSYLFIKQERGCYEDIPIGKEYLCKTVKKYSGYSPKVLRISCLNEMANIFGPQFLREAYGVSNTHAGRFGKYEDYLLDNTVNSLLAMRK
jgi:site-specific recombinase XerD